MRTEKHYMAIDQYGRTYHGLTHPRKDLMTRLYNKHCRKMYRDDTDGIYYHVGYVIGGLWLHVYEVKPMRRPA